MNICGPASEATPPRGLISLSRLASITFHSF